MSVTKWSDLIQVMRVGFQVMQVLGFYDRKQIHRFTQITQINELEGEVQYSAYDLFIR